jgi:hypothetical protein
MKGQSTRKRGQVEPGAEIDRASHDRFNNGCGKPSLRGKTSQPQFILIVVVRIKLCCGLRVDNFDHNSQNLIGFFCEKKVHKIISMNAAKFF